MVRNLMRTAGVVLMAVGISGLPNPIGGTPQPTPRFAVPLSLLEEHAELHTAFETAARLPGKTGEAARRVIALRAPHVEKEQRIAYPLLRLLPMIADGPVEPWMTELLPLADQLRDMLPEFKREHVEILRTLEVMRTEAWAEGHPEDAFLAQRLKHHIAMEEEILYPAALVTAEHVRTLRGTARDLNR